jgi:hypothetical protein
LPTKHLGGQNISADKMLAYKGISYKTYRLQTYLLQNESADYMYWLQNVSTTKRIGYKTYRLQNVSADIKRIESFKGAVSPD